MRLLKLGHGGEFSLTQDFISGKTPPYAILSHTWGSDTEEVTFKDLIDGTGKDKAGYNKLRFCAEQAIRDGLRYFWVDTCCIDKSNSNELSEAINSMFRWYHESTRCYVYLSDISITRHEQNGEQSELLWEPAFRASRWFTRGWTLQELVAPVSVEFFTREGRRLGNKTSLETLIHEISGIPIRALRRTPLPLFGVDERLKWAETRQTTRDEDWAYCLLGIFGVFLPLIYGEGKENAIRRLKKEIDDALNREDEALPLPVNITTIGRRANKQNASHWVVPFDRNKDFVGRESILAQLLETIPPSADNDACQRTAIEGLGGVGKTQIALEAAFRVREKHRDCSVFWVPAIDAATFERAYRDIGRHLRVQGVEEDKADVKLLVKTALSQSDHAWLLVIDNADDTDLLLGTCTVGASSLFDYLPSGYHGSILFTTRNDAVVRELDIPRSNVIRVTEMSRPEAVELLQRNLGLTQLGDSDSTTQLLDFLADLPLAIKQASAYMAKTGMPLTKYLDYCQSSKERLIELLSKNFADRGRYKTAENAIATTWLISFRHISRDNPLAAQYLKFMSFLAEKEIPTSLLPPGDELEVEEAIGTLQSYAFISKRLDQTSYDMHRLVPLVMRNWLAAKGRFRARVTAVIQRLDEAFPFPHHYNRATWEKYLPHARKVLEFRDRSTDKLAVSRLLFNVAESNVTLGKYTEAEAMFRETLALQTEALGAEHSNTLTSANNLATALRSQGKYAMAEEIYRETLVLRTKTLGTEHPDTLRSRNGLTNTLSSQGKHAEAEVMYWETLMVQTRKLGARHLDTLRSKNNLANALGSQGKYAQAEAIYRETLMLLAKEGYDEHPDTLTSKNNLALTLASQGKYVEAEKMYRETLVVQSKVLGAEHPDTVWSKNSFAITLYSQGKFAEAEAIHREALVLRTKALNAGHPSIHWSRNGLANTLGSQGKYAEAEAMYRETLALQTKALGADHPDTLTSSNGLAIALFSQEKNTEAEAVYRETFALRTKTLGAEHPDTLRSRSGLANALGSQGKHVEAEKLHRETLTLQTKMLGAEHPDTLWSRNSLASTLYSQGKYAEAEVTYRETLVLRTKALGAEHPSTLWTKNGLANALGGQGKFTAAEEMHWETLALQTKTLGAEHPDTLTSRNSLAIALSSQEKDVQAEAIHRETLMLQTKAFGAENPDTFRIRNGLASALNNQGKYTEAEAIYRETLAIQTKVLGAEHLDTLMSRHNLALALGRQGKHAEAEKMHWETLAAFTTVLGARHPNTIKSRDGLASALCGQGKHAEAETVYRETLSVQEPTGFIVYGGLDVLRSKNNLARELSHQGKHAEAEVIYQRTLSSARALRLSGKNFDTVSSQYGLVSALRSQGKFVEAEAVAHMNFHYVGAAPK